MLNIGTRPDPSSLYEGSGHETRVYSRFLFCLHGATGHHKKNHMLTLVYEFKRGGATKMLIVRSCNNGEKNCLDLYQVSKCPNRIMFIFCLCWIMKSVNILANLLEAIFGQTDWATDRWTEAIAWPHIMHPCCRNGFSLRLSVTTTRYSNHYVSHHALRGAESQPVSSGHCTATDR